ncbi:response regulator transcription factor [Sphingopyxis sp. PET50]|uniref:response regulator n=1 Tax=Sphingopyxis sp. PET50 TaxID=2976533 RepID=UPI0021AFFDFC|nr:response regulator transcription factor [Sphingopyxis sp. PET50]
MQRILIADDHPLFRSALVGAVHRVVPAAKINECASLTEAFDELSISDADLILLDLRLPDADGFDGLLKLRTRHPAIPVVVVSASEDAETIRHSLLLGASGFIPKSAELGLMATALQSVLSGEIWYPERQAPPDETSKGGANLTPMQMRILAAMQDGRLNKQIAYDLGVSEATVKGHITEIFRKMGVANRTQAVLASRQMGLRHES